MENKSNGGLGWSGQRLAACYFLVRTTTAGLVWIKVWTLICCTFHIFCFSLAQTSVRGFKPSKGGVKIPLISFWYDCYFGRPFLCSVLPAVTWNLRGFFSKISSRRTLLHNQLVGFMVSGYTWHTGLPVRGSSFLESDLKLKKHESSMGKGIEHSLERKGADKIRDMNRGFQDRVVKEFEVQMWRDVSRDNWTAWGQWTGRRKQVQYTRKSQASVNCQASALSKHPWKTAQRPIKRTKLTAPRKHSTKVRKK